MARLITGQELDLPMLIHTSTVHNPSAKPLSWHMHKGTELVFLLRGATLYEFADGTTMALSGGHFLVVPVRTQHRGGHEMRMPSTLVGLVCDLRRQPRELATPLIGGELKRLTECFLESGGGVFAFGPTLSWILPRLWTEIEGWNLQPGDPFRKAVLRLLACTALVEAASQINRLRRGPCQNPETAKIVLAAMDYLRAHAAEPLQIAELVKHLGLGRARIYELFSTEIGLTPHDYWQRARLEKAQVLLRDTHQSVTEIAFAMGFESSQHFSRVFRKYVGESPGDYRKRSNQQGWPCLGAP